ncbi:YopX family protein [Bacillus wiedmannii]|uniref:YopX family protein n=1 Tax=Bacillus wiedmannii TaxID=1890302 RepID=UPI00086A69C1|nr:YopX family protein [Bacillus wiedmannii]SCN11863.1 YopX superfamily phage related protein [Bacillus wiedmannii]
MSTVEFRAWDIKRKEMIYIDDLYFFEQEGIHEIIDGIAKGHHAEYKVMQYIGRKDKYGKKIFEKDIVEYNGWFYIIKWDKEDAGFYMHDKNNDEDDHLRTIDISVGEVMGNIYENQNLIK